MSSPETVCFQKAHLKAVNEHAHHNRLLSEDQDSVTTQLMNSSRYKNKAHQLPKAIDELYKGEDRQEELVDIICRCYQEELGLSDESLGGPNSS